MQLTTGTPARAGIVITPDATLEPRLQPPRSLLDSIDRPYLMERLRQGIAGQVVLINAPAGFGKTGLMAAAFRCFAEPGQRPAWMTLTGRDEDPHLALRGMVAALRRAGAFDGRADPVDLRGLVEALAAEPDRFVLFLDDFCAAKGSAFPALFDEFLRVLPAQVRLVISASGRPGIALSRFRLRGLLAEIQAEHLAFSRGETQRLLGRLLSREELEGFCAVTQGWPALVRLAAPLLAAGPGPDERQALLAGTHAIYADFVHDELLPAIPPDLREAIAACSILDEFPLDLASHLAGFEVAHRAPRDIESLHPVIDPVPRNPGWLRLHPVLRAALASDLAYRSSERISALHAMAAKWFAERGFLEKAVRHAARAGDFVTAADAIRRAGGVKLFIRAGYTVLNAILANLPPEVVHRSATLKLCHALVLSKQGQVPAAREAVEDLKRMARRGGDQAEPFPEQDLFHIEGLINVYEDVNLDGDHIMALERRVAAFGPADTWQCGWIYNHLCIAYTRRGDLAAARIACIKALACYREERTAYGQIFMLVHQGLVGILSGGLSSAILALKEAEALIHATQWSDANLLAIVHMPLGEALYLRGEVAEANRYLTDAMPHMAAGEGWVDLFIRGYGTKARAALRLEGPDAAFVAVDRVDEVAIERHLPRLTTAALLLRIEILTQAGMLESALRLLDQMPGCSDVDGPAPDACMGWPTWRERNEALLNRARLMVRMGEPERAIRLLGRVAALAEASGASLHLLDAALLTVEAAWSAGRPDEALAALQTAVALARPQEILQPFLDAGGSFAQAVRAIVRRFGLSIFAPATARFIARIAGVSFRAPGEGAVTHLLSLRERQVLELLTSGSSNKEIARALGLSDATVKFHLKNVYAKIGVSRRGIAVALASEIGLVDKPQRTAARALPC
ncbi:LuxR C-terminal-related transcriptional regulator [Labrys wisconsinensis]|uniref:LuxR family maltose regulon positive regulatory protein n=1 Tax=Labrys wisconsinensis TaxID=425677 RepID=A0ABU0J5H2_9HYPH|nr:LuxR C-terminal-related transcriptional regulator [Labrys wisconsinensis]MDQ0469511.1 LuxR family maltose regulon positive regulatory protein [Labrys wisconsinensis]